MIVIYEDLSKLRNLVEVKNCCVSDFIYLIPDSEGRQHSLLICFVTVV